MKKIYSILIIAVLIISLAATGFAYEQELPANYNDVSIEGNEYMQREFDADYFPAECSLYESSDSFRLMEADSRKSNTESYFGAELASASGWTSEGWNGSFSEGFEHIIGKTTPLVYSMPEATGTSLYQVEFDVVNCSKAGAPNASTAFSVTLGNSAPFITYNGGGPRHYAFGIRSVENGDFKIILTKPADPHATEGNFDGTIKNISIRKIVETVEPDAALKDENGNVILEIRTAGNNNVYLGNNTGSHNTSGELNVGIGTDALKINTSGYWNTAIGAEALENNTVGSRNVAIGRLAMNKNISGDRNYAIGTFALMRNISGRFNIAVGADALWCNTTGNRNIAIGSASQSGTTTSNDNISIGHDSMAGRVSGSNNIAIGTFSQYEKGQSNANIALGMYSQYNGGGTGYNINIGNTSGNDMTVVTNSEGKVVGGATSNVGVGHGTLAKTTTGKYNVSIGHLAGYSGKTSECNVYVGMFSGKDATGSHNTFLGANSGSDTTTGSNNIAIGAYTNISSPEKSNQLNIGNTIYGNLSSKQIGIGTKNDGNLRARLDVGAGNEQFPPVAIAKGNKTSVPVDGAIEYDGENIYFTRDGVRERVILESDVQNIVKGILEDYGISREEFKVKTTVNLQSTDVSYILNISLDKAFEDMLVIVAGYDCNDEIYCVDVVNLSTMQASFEKDENIKYFKTFVWDEDMHPLSKSVKTEIK